MRSCDACSLCCKLERVDPLEKPRNQWCGHCQPGNGCQIYDRRPDVCRGFRCQWLDDPLMGDFMRPDKAHLYVSIDANGLARVIVDPDHPYAAQYGLGLQIVNKFKACGHHVLVVCDKQLNFIIGDGQTPPEKLIIDWPL